MYHKISVQEQKRKKHIKGNERIKREEILTRSLNTRIFLTKSLHKINNEAV